MTEISENNLKDRINLLEENVQKIQIRNLKVEGDKSWETSSQRKILVAVVTYITVVIIMYFLKIENIFINALIPTF
ncbi:MAG: hypothetical protein LRZ97_01095 [Candidatus Pacebacteria bacterium]|nr:hypothetical protein [Candidatus Paceibacterota bacterium]